MYQYGYYYCLMHIWAPVIVDTVKKINYYDEQAHTYWIYRTLGEQEETQLLGRKYPVSPGASPCDWHTSEALLGTWLEVQASASTCVVRFSGDWVEYFAEKSFILAPVRDPISGKGPREVTHGLNRDLPHNLWSQSIDMNKWMNRYKLSLML